MLIVIGHSFFTCFSSPASFLSFFWDSGDTRLLFCHSSTSPRVFSLGCLFRSVFSLVFVLGYFYVLSSSSWILSSATFIHWLSSPTDFFFKFWLVSAFFTSKFPFDVPSIFLLKLYFFIFFKCVHDSLVKHFY